MICPQVRRRPKNAQTGAVPISSLGRGWNASGALAGCVPNAMVSALNGSVIEQVVRKLFLDLSLGRDVTLGVWGLGSAFTCVLDPHILMQKGFTNLQLIRALASFSTTTKAVQGQKWCGTNPKPWSVKCAWDSKDCSACPECAGKCFCFVYVQANGRYLPSK